MCLGPRCWAAKPCSAGSQPGILSSGLGFLGFEFKGLGFRFQGLGFKVKVYGLGFKFLGLASRCLDHRCTKEGPLEPAITKTMCPLIWECSLNHTRVLNII